MNHFLFIIPPHSKGMNGESYRHLNQLQFQFHHYLYLMYYYYYRP